MTSISTVQILGNSLRSLVRRWPVVLTLYGLTFLLVLPVVLAFRATLASLFLENPDIDRMVGGFDFTMYTDFMSSNRGAVDFFQRTAGPFALVTIILHGIFGAGVVASIAGEGTVGEFMVATGRFIWRSIRLIVYALVTAVAVLAIWVTVLAIAWGAMTSGPAIETQLVTASAVLVALFLLPVAILSLATEYGRILIVREDRRTVLRSLIQGLTFVLRHPVRMILQHGAIFLTMLVLVFLYWLVEAEIGMTTVGGIVVLLLIQQASIVLRIAIRVWQTSSAVALVDALMPMMPDRQPEVPATLPIEAAPAPTPTPSAPPPDEPVKKRPARRRLPAPKRKVGRTVRRLKRS